MEANLSKMIDLNDLNYRIWKGKMEIFMWKIITYRWLLLKNWTSLMKNELDEIQELWLLGSLLNSWKMLRNSLSNSVPYGVITMGMAKSSLLNEGMERKSRGCSSKSKVLVTEKSGRSKSKGLKNRDKSSGKWNKFANVECYHCGKKWYLKKYCTQWKKRM